MCMIGAYVDCSHSDAAKLAYLPYRVFYMLPTSGIEPHRRALEESAVTLSKARIGRSARQAKRIKRPSVH